MFEVGKYYKDKRGEVIKIVTVDPGFDTQYPVRSNERSWTKDGLFHIGTPEHPASLLPGEVTVEGQPVMSVEEQGSFVHFEDLGPTEEKSVEDLSKGEFTSQEPELVEVKPDPNLFAEFNIEPYKALAKIITLLEELSPLHRQASIAYINSYNRRK